MLAHQAGTQVSSMAVQLSDSQRKILKHISIYRERLLKYRTSTMDSSGVCKYADMILQCELPMAPSTQEAGDFAPRLSTTIRTAS